jgi:hypothetical protein
MWYAIYQSPIFILIIVGYPSLMFVYTSAMTCVCTFTVSE